MVGYGFLHLINVAILFMSYRILTYITTTTIQKIFVVELNYTQQYARGASRLEWRF